MNRISGALKALPFAGFFVIMGTFALAGMPPFSIFFSELTILIAGFTSQHYVAGGLFLLFIAVVFSGLVYHMGRVVFGKKPEEAAVVASSPGTKAAFLFLFSFILLLGLVSPFFFRQMLGAACEVLQ
jgi:hydrogenase-4 component F